MATILVVDDEPNFLSFMSAALAREGHNILGAGDGLEALEVLEHWSVDLIITDVFMPNRDGIELMIALRARFASLPAIAVTGGHAGMTRPLTHAMRIFGAATVLEKPFTPNELTAAVATALEPGERPPGRAPASGSSRDYPEG